MKKTYRMIALSLTVALGAMSISVRAQVTLNVMSGGSQNMVDYVHRLSRAAD